MAARRDKQRRTLLALESGVPNQALQRVVARLQKERVSIQDLVLNDRAIDRALTLEYGQLLAEIPLVTSSGTFTWELGSPPAVLQAYLQSPALAPYVKAVLEQRGLDPRYPLRLIYYCDELTPGAALKVNNKRKTNAYYVTLLELPAVLRAHREVWFPMGFIRSVVARDVAGGWTAIANKLMELTFLGPHSIADAGVVIKLAADSAPRIVFFEMYALIGDAPALQSFMGSKGVSAVVPCPFGCSNVTSTTSTIVAHDDSGVLVDTTCSDKSKLLRATNEHVWEKFDELEALQPTRITKALFIRMDMSAGLSYVPNGVLANRALRRYVRPADAIAVDPMHVLVSNGLVNFEVFELFKSCGWGVCYDSMRTLAAANWRSPKFRRGIDIKRPFDAPHQKASDSDTRTFKCQASELLTVMPLVRYFVDSVIARDGSRNREVESFRSAHDLLSLTMESKARGNVEPDRLDRAGSRHLEAFKGAYGTDALKPKHHADMHIGDNARKFNRIADCFTQERKGGSIKAAADSIDFTDRYERTTFLRVVHGELRALSDPSLWSNRLLGKTERFPELTLGHGALECISAAKIYWQHVTYAADDMILVDGGTPCFVEAAVCFDGCRFALLVSQCTAGAEVTHTASRWRLRRDQAPCILFLDERRYVKHAAMWDFEDALHVLVIER